MRILAWAGFFSFVLVSHGPHRALAATDVASPPTPQQRYAEARQLMEGGRYLEAAAAFRVVADSDDADQRLRAQALYSAGLMQENARAYEGADATYQEVQHRFPGTEFAVRAKGQQEVLKQGGARWIAFRRQLDDAWDQRSRAAALVEREGPQAGRAELERAAELFAGLLHDFGDQTNASDLAMALGETHMLLGRFGEARADYERAVALARARIESSPQTPGFDNLVRGAEEKLAEAEIALRRQRIAKAARALLALVGAVFLALRPWRGFDRNSLVLGGTLAAATGVLAVFAVGIAYVVRVYVDQGSPITDGVAALLVLLPGLTGEIVVLGVTNGLRASSGSSRNWPTFAAAGLGAVAALSVTICLVDAFELFPFLDSML